VNLKIIELMDLVL